MGECEAENKPIKVDKWDGAAVKNALDDAAKNILKEKFGYEEDYRLMDGRLAIAFIACSLAMFALGWDYFFPFPESRPILIFCSLSYFVLMGILTLYITTVEKGCFCIFLDKDPAGVDRPNQWKLRSHLKRFDDIYTLELSFIDGKTNASRDASVTDSVAAWFDENGALRSDLFDPAVAKLHSSLTKEKKVK